MAALTVTAKPTEPVLILQRKGLPKGSHAEEARVHLTSDFKSVKQRSNMIRFASGNMMKTEGTKKGKTMDKQNKQTNSTTNKSSEKCQTW